MGGMVAESTPRLRFQLGSRGNCPPPVDFHSGFVTPTEPWDWTGRILRKAHPKRLNTTKQIALGGRKIPAIFLVVSFRPLYRNEKNKHKKKTATARAPRSVPPRAPALEGPGLSRFRPGSEGWLIVFACERSLDFGPGFVEQRARKKKHHRREGERFGVGRGGQCLRLHRPIVCRHGWLSASSWH